MQTERTPDQIEFHVFGRLEVVGRFDGGQISSDGGALLLRETEQRTGILSRLTRQFIDYRDPERIEHSVAELVAQRVLGTALGYEDLNDHDALSSDSLLAMLVGKSDPTGQGSTSGAGSGQAAGEFQHAEPVGVDPAGCE